jgi:hypothetical protein
MIRIAPIVILCVAFCFAIARMPTEQVRSRFLTGRRPRVAVAVWAIIAVPVTVAWVVTASSSSRPTGARVVDAALAAIMVTGLVKLATTVRGTGQDQRANER